MSARVQCHPILLSALLAALLAACAQSTSKPQWSEVPIPDFASIAGQWEGTMRRNPPIAHMAGDWVKVTLTPDGRYTFETYRMIGVFRGEGQLTIDDGKAVAARDGASVRFTLMEADDVRILRALGSSRDGIIYWADLTPSR